MPLSARHQRWIAQRCWHIYEAIVRTLTPDPRFHLEFPGLAELALLSRALQARVPLAQGYLLEVHEEYDFRERQLIVTHYSYVLLDSNGIPLLRADPLPHHRLDYRRRKLTNFPHHLHDRRGCVHSFSGRFEDFLNRAAALVQTA